MALEDLKSIKLSLKNARYQQRKGVFVSVMKSGLFLVGPMQDLTIKICPKENCVILGGLTLVIRTP